MTAPPVPPPAVELLGVEVRYGQIVALRGTDLAVERGRVCGLVGMNGAGKTSLLKAVLGLTRPARGTVLIDGLDPALARRAGSIGYVPQGEEVDWDFPLSVRDVVSMGRFAYQGPTRRSRAVDRVAVDAAIERVGLTALAGRQIGALSGGQRKRAFLARGIAQAARVLLLDEPFAGVDRTSQDELTALVRELAADGATVLVSTHDLASAPTLCDEVALVRGSVLHHGPPREVMRPELLAEAFGVPLAPVTTPADGASTARPVDVAPAAPEEVHP